MQSKQIIRNNTSFPIQVTAILRDLYDKYKGELEDTGDSGNSIGDSNILSWAKNLKYYQYLIKELILNDSFTENEYARGLLIYHTMGMGKTRLAVSVAMSCWNIYQPVVLLPQGLKKNFKKTIEGLIKLISNKVQISQEDIKDAINKFQFVSMDAYNSSTQMENIKKSENDIPFDITLKAHKKKELKAAKRKALKSSHKKHGGDLFQNGLDNKLLIVDEAHNFFRSIINSGSENSNAKKIYEMIMTAKNLKILFLTGTPCAKDPFELVPCFNMLTGKNLLPTSYEIFYSAYVDKATNGILNKNKLANRLLGLVSHVTHNKNSEPSTSEDAKKEKKRQNRDLGWFPECKPLIVSYIGMSPTQYKQYLLAREKENAEKGRGMGKGDTKLLNPTPKPLALPNSENQTMGSYYVKSRMLSNFAPPREYIDSPIEDIPKNLFNKQTSPKLALIADRVHDAKGSVLVYSQFVDRGGLKPLTKFLENKNFTEFNIADAVHKYSHILKAKKTNISIHIDEFDTDDIDIKSIKNDIKLSKKDIKLNKNNLNIGNILQELDKLEEVQVQNDDFAEMDTKIYGGKQCLNTCSNSNTAYTMLSNKEFEQLSNENEKNMQLVPKTYITYSDNLDILQLRNRLKDWEEVSDISTDEYVDFAWGTLLKHKHYDVNFFNQKAKLKNILMNSKSIITNKGQLYKTFSSFMEAGKYIPKTFDLQTFDNSNLQKPYIVKDATSFGQKGVHIVTSLEDINKYKHKLKHTLGIISEYITNPLLWGGKKFHFRIYVGIYVNKNGTRKVKIFNNSNYAFKVFIAKKTYKPNHFDDIDMHITGMSSTLRRHQWRVVSAIDGGHHLNSIDANANIIDGGNKVKANRVNAKKVKANKIKAKKIKADIIKELKEENDNFYFVESDLPPNTTFTSINTSIEKMFDELIKPILPKFELYPECDAGFEIFGADVMLDNEGNPYLLEINAKLGYGEDYGQQEGQSEYYKVFCHDFFNWIVDEFVLLSM